jgi:hypothetical protein
LAWECEELVGVLCGEGSELVTDLANVDAVEFGGAVGEAAVRDIKTDTWWRL